MADRMILILDYKKRVNAWCSSKQFIIDKVFICTLCTYKDLRNGIHLVSNCPVKEPNDFHVIFIFCRVIAH